MQKSIEVWAALNCCWESSQYFLFRACACFSSGSSVLHAMSPQLLALALRGTNYSVVPGDVALRILSIESLVERLHVYRAVTLGNTWRTVRRIHLQIYDKHKSIALTSRSLSSPSNIGIMLSNPTRVMDAYLCFSYILLFSVGRCLAICRSTIQGALQIVLKIHPFVVESEVEGVRRSNPWDE
jgi:hypothetical protein